MRSMTRYFRLLYALGRFSLATELAFRGNFLIKITVEILWLAILLIFTRTLFSGPSRLVAGWTEPEYLFFVGCYFALEGLMETFFLVNCGEFTELVRTGNLDLYLALRDKDELTLRVNVARSFNPHGSHEEVVRRFEELPGKDGKGGPTGVGDDWVRIGPIKMYMDGGMLNGTAYMRQPWPPGDTSPSCSYDCEKPGLQEYALLGWDLEPWD